MPRIDEGPPQGPPPPEALANYPEYDELDPIQLVRQGIAPARLLSVVNDFFHRFSQVRNQTHDRPEPGEPTTGNSLVFYLIPDTRSMYEMSEVLRFSASKVPSPDEPVIRFSLIGWEEEFPSTERIKEALPDADYREAANLTFVTVAGSRGDLISDTQRTAEAVATVIESQDIVTWAKPDHGEVFVAIQYRSIRNMPMIDTTIPFIVGMKLTRMKQGTIEGSVTFLVQKSSANFGQLTG